MGVVELGIVVVTKLSSQQRQVDLRNDECAGLARERLDRGLLQHLIGVLPCFVVIVETGYSHAVDTVQIVNGDIEITDKITREVIAGHLEQQLVLPYRIGRIEQQEAERSVALIAELHLFLLVCLGQHLGTPLPEIANVEMSAVELSAGLHSVDDHSGQFGQLTLGEMSHQRVHRCETSLAVTLVETAQSTDEDELIAVLSLGEPLGRNAAVGRYLGIALSLESIVGGTIERVLYLLAIACVGQIVGI